MKSHLDRIQAKMIETPWNMLINQANCDMTAVVRQNIPTDRQITSSCNYKEPRCEFKKTPEQYTIYTVEVRMFSKENFSSAKYEKTTSLFVGFEKASFILAFLLHFSGVLLLSTQEEFRNLFRFLFFSFCCKFEILLVHSCCFEQK